MGTVYVFQNNTMQRVLTIVGDINRGMEGRIDNETMVEFVKPEYVIKGVWQSWETTFKKEILFQKVQGIMKICNESLERLSMELGRIWEWLCFSIRRQK